MSKARPDKKGIRIAELERKLSESEKRARGLEGQVEELREQLGWVRNLEPDDAATVRKFLYHVDATALLSSANQAIRPRPKVSGGSDPAMFDPTSVYAHNYLEGVMDHLDRLAGEVATWNRTTPATASLRRSCRNCRRQLDLLTERYCTVCGQDLRPEGEAA